MQTGLVTEVLQNSEHISSTAEREKNYEVFYE